MDITRDITRFIKYLFLLVYKIMRGVRYSPPNFFNDLACISDAPTSSPRDSVISVPQPTLSDLLSQEFASIGWLCAG